MTNISEKIKEELKINSKSVYARIEAQNYTTSINTVNHAFLADEPQSLGGLDEGPTPNQLLSASLAACTIITLKMYADRKGWPLSEAKAYVNHYKTEQESVSGPQIDVFDTRIELVGDLSEEQKERLLQIAKKCPVHTTLKNQIRIDTTLTNLI